jgi:hypothetical protein
MLKSLKSSVPHILDCQPLVLKSLESLLRKSLEPPGPLALKSLESLVAKSLNPQHHASWLLSWQCRRGKLVEAPKGNNLESHHLVLKSL